MRIKTTYLTLALATVLPSCTDNEVPTTGSPDEVCSLLTIEASKGCEADTRATISATGFGNGETIGIFIGRSDKRPAIEPFANRSLNIKATRKTANASGWEFQYENSYSTFTDLYIIGDKQDPHNADFYAYAPWQAGITDLTEIPFELANDLRNQTDILWAKENASDKNKDIVPGRDWTTPDYADKCRIVLNFQHLLTRLNFNFRLKSNKNYASVGVTKIKLTNLNHGLTFYTGGTYSALDGTVNPGSETVESLTFTGSGNSIYTITASGKDKNDNWLYTDVPVLLIPTQPATTGGAADKLLHVEIHLNNSTDPLYEFDITRGMITHSNGTTVGFQPNCIYNFNFLVENYVHLDEIIVDETWTEGKDKDGNDIGYSL